MSARITLADVERPAGSPEGWLAERARAAPGTGEPLVAVALGHGGLTRAVREGVPLDNLPAVESALVARLRPDWVGAVGSGVVWKGGRPLPVRFARLREQNGGVWVALWFRLPGMTMGVVPDEVWKGDFGRLPAWLVPLAPAWPEPDNADSDTVVEDGPCTLTWRRDPSIAPPAFTVALPPECRLRDVLDIAAGLLSARFETVGSLRPTVVVWSEGELCGWESEGYRGPQEAIGLGRRLARGKDVQAAGVFGPGRERHEGVPMSLAVLVLEDRNRDSVVWRRAYQRVGDHVRWVDEAPTVQAPGPRLGWFET